MKNAQRITQSRVWSKIDEGKNPIQIGVMVGPDLKHNFFG